MPFAKPISPTAHARSVRFKRDIVNLYAIIRQ